MTRTSFWGAYSRERDGWKAKWPLIGALLPFPSLRAEGEAIQKEMNG